MARKMVLAPQYLTATSGSPDPQSQSLSASFDLVATQVSFQDNISYQINVVTTDSEGQFTLQASNDGINWIDLEDTGTVAAANDTIGINVNQFPYEQIRLHYESDVAGTGTAEIILMARTVGA